MYCSGTSCESFHSPLCQLSYKWKLSKKLSYRSQSSYATLINCPRDLFAKDMDTHLYNIICKQLLHAFLVVLVQTGTLEVTMQRKQCSCCCQSLLGDNQQLVNFKCSFFELTSYQHFLLQSVITCRLLTLFTIVYLTNVLIIKREHYLFTYSSSE